MAKLYLQRHLKSQWNLDDRFAGWTDGPLTKDSNVVAAEIAKEVAQIKFDKIYSSALIRNMDTIVKVFDNITDKYPLFIHLDGGKMQEWGNFEGSDEKCVQVFVTEKLNERHYGELQGLNKADTKKKFGEEQVLLWRTSYSATPPGGESGIDVYNRVSAFFIEHIEKDLKEGKNILVVASHHPLRAIVKYLENIPDENMTKVELPFGTLVKYDFDGKEYKKI